MRCNENLQNMISHHRLKVSASMLNVMPRNCLIPVHLSRISSLLPHLISIPGLLAWQVLRFLMQERVRADRIGDQELIFVDTMKI